LDPPLDGRMCEWCLKNLAPRKPRIRIETYYIGRPGGQGQHDSLPDDIRVLVSVSAPALLSLSVEPWARPTRHPSCTVGLERRRSHRARVVVIPELEPAPRAHFIRWAAELVFVRRREFESVGRRPDLVWLSSQQVVTAHRTRQHSDHCFKSRVTRSNVPFGPSASESRPERAPPPLCCASYSSTTM
jgi:hypothetical protein